MMTIYFLFTTFLLLSSNVLFTNSNEQEEIIVHLGELGSVRGLQIKSAKSNIGISDYKAFYGIPYAYPPLGKLRFKPTKLLEKFNEKENVFDATDAEGTSKSHCPFMSWVSPLGLSVLPVLGQEDCLTINVYTPSSATKGDKLPVMVWIHGGAFLTGSNDPYMYGPHYFYSDKDQMDQVILVTVNYRLGVLGFLSLEDEIAPGNLGLRDQNLALQWVQKHISNFGGDKDKVTVFGLSAGAQSTNYHVLSPRSKGLFDKAIMHSDYRPGIEANPLSYATALASEVGCDEWDDNDAKDTLACLQEVAYEKLIEKGHKWETFMWHYRPWKPIVDGKFLPKQNIGKSENEQDQPITAFLPNHPNTLMQNGEFNKVPIIMGGVENELACLMPQYINEDGWKLKKLADGFDQLGPEFLLGLAPEEVTNEDTATANIIRIEYMNEETCGGNTNLTLDNIHQLEKMLTDTVFLVPIDRKIKTFAKQLSTDNIPVYYYRYRHKGSITLPKIRFNITIDFGVSHGDDNFIMFHQAEPVESLKSEEDAKMSKKLVSMWTRFATYGSPTKDGEWLPVASTDMEEPKYAVLNNYDLKMVREDSFNKKSKMITDMEELGESFKAMNVSEHPAIKKMEANQQKQFEEEHAKDLEGGPEDEHQPTNNIGGVPDDMLKDQLSQPSREGGMNLQESVMDYISKHILTEEKPGEENEEDDDHEDILGKEEL